MVEYGDRGALSAMSHLQIFHFGEECGAAGVELLGCWVGVYVEDTCLVAVRGGCCHFLKRVLGDTFGEESQ